MNTYVRPHPDGFKSYLGKDQKPASIQYGLVGQYMKSMPMVLFCILLKRKVRFHWM